MYSHGHGISSVVVIQLTLAVKQVLHISNFTVEFLTWMSVCLSTVITREVFFCPDKIEFFYDNLVAW
jgi:hypothetical protein